MLDATAIFWLCRETQVGDLSFIVGKVPELQEATCITFSEFMKGKMCSVQLNFLAKA